jgi:DNA polymerase III alpha subunit (gram-positive type)
MDQMTNYYIDIETTGLNPKKDKIITIQYQILDRKSGEPLSPLKILTSWSSSEKEIILEFFNKTKIKSGNVFDFIPVGYNLDFINSFLRERTKFHNLGFFSLLSRPSIDLRSVGVLMNKGEFRGSGLNELLQKQKISEKIPLWYENKDYEKILNYIKTKSENFLSFNHYLCKRLPLLLEEFNQSNN